MDDFEVPGSQRIATTSRLYGPVIVASLFLFLTVNFAGVVSLVSPTDVEIQGFGKASKVVAADKAEIHITASVKLGSSPKQVSEKITDLAGALSTYLKSLDGVSFTSDPMSLSNNTIQFGAKYAMEYTGEQTFYVQISDVSKLDQIVKKAAEIGFGDIREATFSLKEETLAGIKSQIIAEATAAAKANAEERAKKQSLKLNSVASADESVSFDSVVIGIQAPGEDDLEEIIEEIDGEEAPDLSPPRPRTAKKSSPSQIKSEAIVTVNYSAR